MKNKLKTFKPYRPAEFKFSFEGLVRVYQGKAPWYFVDLPTNLTAELNELFSDQKRGFGSLPVEAELNGFVWTTSIFPDSQTKTFMLPLKLAVRQHADLATGDSVTVTLKIKI